MKFFIIFVTILAGISISESKNTNPICEICKYLVNDIDEQLLDGATQDDIVAAVEKICGPLDSIIQGATHACELIIETQLPEIIDAIVNNQLDPQGVCHSIGLCPTPTFLKQSLLDNTA